MITHAKIHYLADVEKFLNRNNLTLQQVQIVHVTGMRTSDYMVFYDSSLIPEPPKETTKKAAGKGKEPEPETEDEPHE